MKTEQLRKKAIKIRNKRWSKRQNNDKRFFKSLHLEEYYDTKYLKKFIQKSNSKTYG